MQLKKIGKGNATIVTTPEVVLLFSYETPVACINKGRFFRTSHHHSQTTSKHINKFLDDYSADEVETLSQKEFDKIALDIV